MHKPDPHSSTQPGTLDPDFGSDGDQTLFTLLKDFPDLDLRFPIRGLATGKDGKLLFSTSSRSKGQYIYVLGRMNADGSLDKSFGKNGLARGDFLPGLGAGGSRLAIQPDGKILMLGWTFPSPSVDWADLVVARFDSEGAVDTAFAEQGRCILPTQDDEGLTAESATLYVQGNGQILITANYSKRSDPDLTVGAVFRLLPDGKLDTQLNGTGKLELKLPAPDAATAVNASISQGSDHRIVLVGHARFTPEVETALFARFNPDGSLDTRFGNLHTPGFHCVDEIANHTTLNALVERADSSIVGAGQVGLNGDERTQGLLRAITPNGAAHLLFNNGAPVISQFDDDNDNGWHCIIGTRSGNLVTASQGGQVYIAQFLANGMLNPAFNNQGYNDLGSPFLENPVLLAERDDGRLIAAANVVGIDPSGVGKLRCLFG